MCLLVCVDVDFLLIFHSFCGCESEFVWTGCPLDIIRKQDPMLNDMAAHAAHPLVNGMAPAPHLEQFPIPS